MFLCVFVVGDGCVVSLVVCVSCFCLRVDVGGGLVVLLVVCVSSASV